MLKKAIREQVWAKSEGRCHYCGCALDRTRPRGFTVDHVIPRSRGGTDELDNLVGACLGCNASKSDDDQPKPIKPVRDLPFALYIADVRDRLGMSPRELARDIGIDAQTIRHWEAGETVASDRARKVIWDKYRHRLRLKKPPKRPTMLRFGGKGKWTGHEPIARTTRERLGHAPTAEPMPQ